MMPFDRSQAPPNTHSQRSRDFLIATITLAAIAFCCGMTVADPDLWGHTLYGLRAIEQNVFVEPVDPFSYTAPGSLWINHEWLTEYQYGWLWKHSGEFGLWAWRTVAAVILFGFGAAALRNANASLGATILQSVFAAECLSTFFIFVRPQLATFVLFAATLFILRRHWDQPESKSIGWLPIIGGLWVNLHGGFLAGLAIIVLFLSAWCVRAFFDPSARKNLVLLGIISVLAGMATLINPYGITMHSMLWVHLVPEQAVAEWQPLWSARQATVYYLPFILFGVSLFGWRRWKWVDAWILAFVLFAAVRHIRHGALLCTTLMILSPGPLTDALQRLFPSIATRIQANTSTKRQWLSVAAAMAILFALHIPGTIDLWKAGLYPWNIAVESSRLPPGVPLRALTLLRQEKVRGNIVTDYAWGQYLLWHSFPDLRVAFDGRYRTIYPEKLEHQFLSFLKSNPSDPHRFELLDQYPSEIVLLPNRTPACEQLLERSDWIRILHDDQASLFVKDIPKFQDLIHRHHSQRLSLPETPRWTIFPGGPAERKMSLANAYQAEGRKRNVEHQ